MTFSNHNSISDVITSHLKKSSSVVLPQTDLFTCMPAHPSVHPSINLPLLPLQALSTSLPSLPLSSLLSHHRRRRRRQRRQCSVPDSFSHVPVHTYPCQSPECEPCGQALSLCPGAWQLSPIHFHQLQTGVLDLCICQLRT